VKGRVEVQIGEQWGVVCSNGFGKEEAQVACRQMWLAGGSVKRVRTPRGNLPYLMASVRCTGKEYQLADCAFITTRLCPGGHPVGVVCKGACMQWQGQQGMHACMPSHVAGFKLSPFTCSSCMLTH